MENSLKFMSITTKHWTPDSVFLLICEKTGKSLPVNGFILVLCSSKLPNIALKTAEDLTFYKKLIDCVNLLILNTIKISLSAVKLIA